MVAFQRPSEYGDPGRCWDHGEVDLKWPVQGVGTLAGASYRRANQGNPARERALPLEGDLGLRFVRMMGTDDGARLARTLVARPDCQVLARAKGTPPCER